MVLQLIKEEGFSPIFKNRVDIENEFFCFTSNYGNVQFICVYIHSIQVLLLNTMICSEDFVERGDGSLSVYKQYLGSDVTHHSQLMQVSIIIHLLLVICISSTTNTMENFNVNFNGSNDDSSDGSSEVTQEALLELCLVGTLLTDKPVRFLIMQDRLSSLWRPGQGVTISQVEENKFLFQFYHEWDMERVLQGGPWTFDGYLLILKKVVIGEAPAETVLNEAEIWVQVFNLPFGFMHESMGMLVGSHIGRYIRYDENNYYGPWRMYMRIRVAMNVNEPLKRSMVFEREDGSAVNILFKYEKLGVFCYCCGILGHTDNFCPKRLEPGFVDGEKGWGKFLQPGNSSLGGGVSVNKWLRGGRMQGRGGRDGGRSGADSGRGGSGNNAGRSVNAGGPLNVEVMGQSSDHSLFGRVRILRGRGFTFHKLVTSVIGHNGGGEGRWIPFEMTETNIANQRAIMSLVNGLATAEAERHTNESQSNVDQNSSLMLEGVRDSGFTGNNGKQMLLGCNQVRGPPIISEMVSQAKGEA